MKQSFLALALGVTLLTGCGAEAGDPEEPATGDLAADESVGTHQEAIRLCNADLGHTYLAGFGRGPEVAEEQYWCPRNVEWNSMQGYFKDWLVSPEGRPEQSATIKRVYKQIYGRSPSSNELRYWMDQAAAKGGFTFSELAGWLADYGRTYGRVTGSAQYWCFSATVGGVRICSVTTYSVTPG